MEPELDSAGRFDMVIDSGVYPTYGYHYPERNSGRSITNFHKHRRASDGTAYGHQHTGGTNAHEHTSADR